MSPEFAYSLKGDDAPKSQNLDQNSSRAQQSAIEKSKQYQTQM